MIVVTLTRDRLTTKGPTMGKLVADGVSYSTLEPPWVNNEHDVSCIPPGRYPLVLSDSPRFGRPMPHVQMVPGRSAILVHPGNTVRETRGCILIADGRIGGTMLSGTSRAASAAFNAWMRAQRDSIVLDVSYGEAA